MLVDVCRALSQLRRTAHLPHYAQLHHVAALQCRLLSTARQVLADSEKDREDQLKVNYFEQDAENEPSRRAAEIDADRAQIDDLKGRIAELENELKQFKMPKSMPSYMVQKILSTYPTPSNETDSLEDDLNELEIFAHKIRPKEKVPREAQIYLDRLNACLDNASLAPNDDTARKELWRWYERSKANVAGLPYWIPDAGWQLLWTSQAAVTLSNADRTTHLHKLAQDMLSAGKSLTEAQRFAHIEGLFHGEKRDEALTKWEESFAAETPNSVEFLELGIRMFSYTGNSTRAVEVLDELFSKHADHDPRIIHPIIATCINLATPADIETAWALYSRLREHLGTNMTLVDFDAVSLGFLRANRKEHALAVFRDMMLCGDKVSKDESLYQSAMKHIGRVLSMTNNVKEVNDISLDTLDYLPRRFQNKFFYASWLKRLIGMAELDAAGQVIELMYERGISPDARHMNGLIGAWIREGNVTAREHAIDIAWTMVQKRVDVVHSRRMNKSTSSPDPKKRSVREADGLEIPRFVDRPVPTANIETFSILVQHYLRRGMFDHVKHLRNLLVDAAIPMNSYFMNHLLFAELRNRSHKEVWARFEVMSKTVVPDMETFTILWECMKFHVDIAVNKDLRGYPTPRQLFARMMTWFNSLPLQARNTAIRDLDLDNYHDIVRSFTLSRDLEGAFVAMHTIEQLFQLYPDVRTVRVLLLQIARLTMRKPRSAAEAASGTRKAENGKALKQTTEILDILTLSRRENLSAIGYEFDYLTPREQAQENHRALLQLLFTIMARRQNRSLAITTPAINKAAAEMGVELFDVEDSMSLVVQ